MNRFYCPHIDLTGNKILIKNREQIHHIKNVLRFKTGDRIIVFDAKGNEYDCVLGAFLSHGLTLDIKDRRSAPPGGKGVKITVACAIPKKSKMEEIIDKLTQLGIDRIIPLETERVIVRWDKDKEISWRQRWQKIALSAAQQSQRNTVPVVEPIQEVREVLSRSVFFDLKLIPTLVERPQPLKDILAKSHPKNILVLIGPEGDFTLEEIESAKKAGCITVSLGNLVLRVETAAVAVASFLRLYL
jgi:16S rRNA (uracil1498-N3)-methyltransferase